MSYAAMFITKVVITLIVRIAVALISFSFQVSFEIDNLYIFSWENILISWKPLACICCQLQFDENGFQFDILSNYFFLNDVGSSLNCVSLFSYYSSLSKLCNPLAFHI